MAATEHKSIHDNVIETLFSTLPKDDEEKKMEQDRRRRVKDKLVEHHPENLIVDSSYISDGKDHKQYTNTILITECLAWWEKKIVDAFTDSYSRNNHTTSGGHQSVFVNSEGSKFLTFSFYPSKKKIMTQGSHADLLKWIGIFRDVSSQKNASSIVQEGHGQDTILAITQGDKPNEQSNGSDDIVVSFKDPETISIENSASKEDTQQTKTTYTTDNNDATGGDDSPAAESGDNNGQSTESDVTITENEHMLFYTPKAPDIEHSELFDDLPFIGTKQNNSSTCKHKRIPRRQSSRFYIPSVTNARDSQRLLQIKDRLDAVDGVIAGLQGGLVDIVDSLASHKLETECSISKLIDLSQQIMEKLSCLQPKPVNNTKEINQVKDCVCQLQNSVAKKFTTLTEQVITLGSNIQKSTDMQRHMKEDILDSMTNESKKITSDVTTHTEAQTRTLTKQMYRVEENVTAKVVQSQQVMRPTRVLTSSQEVKETSAQSLERCSHHRANGRSSERDNEQNRNEGNQHIGKRNYQRAADRPIERDSENKEISPNRTVLLMGDSTTKLIDRRGVVRDEVISKCRVSTISEAHFKMTTSSNHIMKKIVFCVGLNDLRDGHSPDQVRDNMKHLLKETLNRHPGCKVYVCSILPTKCSEVMKQNIKQANSHFARLSTIMEEVFYVDILSEFVTHRPMQDLFERDEVHPNGKGALIMAVCIRNSLLSNHKTPRPFTSRQVNTSVMSYAGSLSSGPGPNVQTSNRQPMQQVARPVNQEPVVYPYHPGTFPGPVWWPPGNSYPPAMSFYPPGMQATYASMYPVQSGR